MSLATTHQFSYLNVLGKIIALFSILLADCHSVIWLYGPTDTDWLVIDCSETEFVLRLQLS